jgi:pimeloyl-ACP methyl ester carboxylesterase
MARFEREGCSLNHEVHGSGPPLLLVHGLGSSARDWEAQLPEFSARFTCIVPDVRGFGQSDKPPGPYSVAEWADDLHALLDHLGHERVDVVGYSMGGAITFQMAVDRPERFHRMVILNSLPSFAIDHWRKHIELWTRLLVVRFLSMDRMARILANRLFPGPDQGALRDTMIERYAVNETGPYLSAVRALAGWTVADRLEGLKMPTLVIAAEEDYTPMESKEAFVREMSNARLVRVANSRHGTPFDQPEIFNQLVLDFLAD